MLIKHLRYTNIRLLSSALNVVNAADKYAILNSSNDVCADVLEEVKEDISKDLMLYENFVTENEQTEVLNEVEKSFRRSKYEFDHWDGAIYGFRETEKSRWKPDNQVVIDRIRKLAFADEVNMIPAIHVLDLSKEGYISPHIDSVKFCGTTIAGLNLMSSAVMRFVHNKEKNIYIDLLLPTLSLYVMKNSFRYDFTHEVLGEKCSYWNKKFIPRDRRVSVIMRNQPV